MENFDPPIEIPREDGGSPILLRSNDEVNVWIAQIIRRWRDTIQSIDRDQFTATELESLIFDQIRRWERIGAEFADYQFRFPRGKERFDLPEKIAEKNAILASELIAERAISLVAIDQSMAIFLLKVANGGLLKEAGEQNSSSPFLFNYAKSVAKLTSTREHAELLSRLGETVDVVNRLAGKARKNQAAADKDFRELREKFEKIITGAENESAAQMRRIDDEWSRLRSVYDASLKLSAPRHYWEVKRETHRKLARSWSAAFVVTASLGGTFIACAMLSLPWLARSYGAVAGIPAWLMPALVLGVPGFLALWALRVCGRQWSEHLVRQEDARERVAMVDTFLALSRSEDSPNTIVDATQLTIVLGALFRAGPGLSQDDSPPAGVVDLLIAKLGGSKAS